MPPDELERGSEEDQRAYRVKSQQRRRQVAKYSRHESEPPQRQWSILPIEIPPQDFSIQYLFGRPQIKTLVRKQESLIKELPGSPCPKTYNNQQRNAYDQQPLDQRSTRFVFGGTGVAGRICAGF